MFLGIRTPRARLTAGALTALTALTALVAGVLHAPPASAATVAMVVGSNVNVRPGLAVEAGSHTASISLARNEFESFQIVVDPDVAIDDLQVDLAGSVTLDGQAATTLPASSFTFYREGYHTVVSNATVDTRSDAESSAGAWPDVLIPQRDYIFGQDRAAFHAPVAADGQVVLWVDVLASRQQHAGTYSGGIRIKDGSTVLQTVPLDVRVRDFTLPSTSSLDNVFLTHWAMPCRAHSVDDYCGWDAELRWRLHALYARAALENRATIANPWPLAKNQSLNTNSDGDPDGWTRLYTTYLLPLIKGQETSPALGSQVRLPGAELTRLALLGPSAFEDATTAGCRAACVADWKQQMAADGTMDKLLYYTCDEPFLDATRWTNCKTVHDQVSGPSGLPELVTGPIQQAQDPGLGDGAQSWIDVMVPQNNQIANKPGSRYHAGNQRPAYNTWLQQAGDGQDNELWVYSSCTSGGCNGRYSADQDPPWNDDYWNGWGGYGIDQPPTQSRAMSWTAFEYDATGELYWHTTQRLNQAWNGCTTQDSCLYDSGMTGDGTLFYPGKACAPSVNDRACIGGAAGTDIPLESIRLKRIRDGREDYEYLNLLASNGDEAFARSTALGVFGPDLDSASFSTTVTPEAIAAARSALADRIEATASTPPPTISVADVRLTEGNNGDLAAGDFVVTRSGDTSAPSSAAASFTDGTATWNGDYMQLANQVRFEAGATKALIPFDVMGDEVEEADETFQVALSPLDNAVIGDGRAVATIVDDDAPSAVYKVDSMVKQDGGTYVGNGVRSTDGRQQTVTVSVRRGVAKSFYVKVGNEGSDVDSYSIVGTPAGDGFRTEYFSSSRQITSPVVAGNWSTGNVRVGGTRVYRVWVKPTQKAKIGSVRTWNVYAVSYRAKVKYDQTVRDMVRIRVRVK